MAVTTYAVQFIKSSPGRCRSGKSLARSSKRRSPVDEHLADRLFIPMALAGGGSFRTTKPSLHTTTNAEVIQRVLSVTLDLQHENELGWRVTVGSI